MPYRVKLSKRDGHTRRIKFRSAPSWDELAEKIHTLYDIPIDKVAVSYIDPDEDEVTLSTEEELQDFYAAVHKDGEDLKFIVQDLRASRREEKALPDTPSAVRGSIRNTFGEGGLPFDLDEDWQIPTLPGIFVAPRMETPHGFVEVVSTDDGLTSVHDDAHSEANSGWGDEKPVSVHTDKKSIHSLYSDYIPQYSSSEKGKAKAMEADNVSIHSHRSNSTTSTLHTAPPLVRPEFSSTLSLVDEKIASKHDLHVYDASEVNPNDSHNFEFNPNTDTFVPTSRTPSMAGTQHPVESTPKAQTSTLPADDAAGSDHTATDGVPRATASLSEDVAALLQNLTTVLASHPELSEGLRNIASNAANGSYWSPDGRNVFTQADRDAGAQVAEALGRFFSMFSTGTSNTNTTPPGPQNSGPSAPWASPWGPRWGYGPMRGGFFPRGRGGWMRSWPFNHFPHHHQPPFPGFPPHGAHVPPPPPPPPGFPPHPGHVPPPPPPPSNGPPGAFPTDDYWGDHTWDPSGMAGGDPNGDKSRSSPQELRAQVEAAKLLYKAEKERYRQDKEARRAERDRQIMETTGINEADITKAQDASFNITTTTITGNPPFVSIPRRSNTIAAPTRSVPVEQPQNAPQRASTQSKSTAPPASAANENNLSRAEGRIVKKLHDMGFTEREHPKLRSKVKAQLPAEGSVTKDKEDDVVTSLLEEFIAKSPLSGPIASTSGARRPDSIPGAWKPT